MQYLINTIKCIMGIISITVGIVCLKKVSKIPYPELRKKENYKLLDRYSYASQMIDCLLIFFTFLLTPPGEYGNGMELICAVLVVLVFAPFTIRCVYRARKKMKLIDTHPKFEDYLSLLKCFRGFLVIKFFFIFLLVASMSKFFDSI